MTRIVSYNILVGGYNLRQSGTKRTQQITKIIRSTQADIVGLVEATHPQIAKKPFIVEEIAEALDMTLIPGEDPAVQYDLALLTRLPVIYTRIHSRPGILNKPLLEVCVEEENGEHLTIFLTHLSAAFNRGWAGSHIRQREMREILRIMAPQREQDIPHLLMGDFNSLAPGDPFKASFLLRYVIQLDNQRHAATLMDGHPHLNTVVPPQLRVLNPLLRLIAQNNVLCTIFDAAASLYAPRGCIRFLCNMGYTDCYRLKHPDSWGFTCPSATPAGRIDYIFAHPRLAERLDSCYIVIEGEGLPGNHASDHLAVAAEFGVRVERRPTTEELDAVMGS